MASTDEPLQRKREFIQLAAENITPSTLLHMPLNDYETTANRYIDILPMEHTRVRLQQPVLSAPSSDYINANYIQFPPALECKDAPHPSLVPSHRVPFFIVGQAPLAHTVHVWWQMVVEQDVQVIVMLTREVEQMQRRTGERVTMVKAERYWPLREERLNFGGLHVDLLQQESSSSDAFTIRYLQLTYPNPGRTGALLSRVVVLFHYTAWPDCGVPALDSFLPFYRAYVQCAVHSVSPAPVLVHCSAGIGRSGVFCALEAALYYRRYAQEKSVYEIVSHMRKCRPNMVQTLEQYSFICDLLADETALNLGNTLETATAADLQCHPTQ